MMGAPLTWLDRENVYTCRECGGLLIRRRQEAGRPVHSDKVT
jgi:hypothetical protein